MNSKFSFYTLILTIMLHMLMMMMVNGEGYDANGYCTLLPENTKLASLESCQKYYECKGGIAVEASCNDLSFDKKTQSCKPASQVECALSDDDDEKYSCEGIAKGFVPVRNSCSAYVYCENGVKIGQTSCPNGMTFNNGRCDYSACTESGSIQLTSSCDVIPDLVFYGTPMNCNDHNICVNGQFHTGTCDPGLVFNIQKQMCSWPSSGNYCEHVTESEILPEGETATASCTTDGEKSSSSSNCSTYYICENAIKTKYNCDKNEFFDNDSLECIDRQLAKPNEDCDRCLGSTKTWVNAVDAECLKYLTCAGGKKTDSGTCPINSYFDEDTQACFPVNRLATYTTTHGACRAVVE